MRRSEFLLTGAATSLPLPVGAQSMRRRIGASDPGLIETSYLSGFPRGMRDLDMMRERISRERTSPKEVRN